MDADKCTGCGVCTAVCPVRFWIQPKEPPAEIAEFKDAEKIDAVIEKNSNFPDPLIQILLDVSHEYNYLPKEVLFYLSYKLDIPISSIYRVATFYKAFSLVKKGKYHIKVCLGTSCHVRGARKLLNAIQSFITDTPEDLFSLETVNCLGACALGPIMMINEDYHGEMIEKMVGEILGGIMEEEGATFETEPSEPAGDLKDVKVGEVVSDLEGGEQ